MIKLRLGQEKQRPLKSTGGNNVESPIDEGSGDQEHLSDNGDREVQQQTEQQRHSDSTDPESTGRAASGHRSGGPASSDKDSNASASKSGKDRHGGMNLDDEAKERQTGEGGPANSAPRPSGQHSHAGR